MIASFETMLFGTITASPLLVRSLVARQVISTTRPSSAPIRTHWPTRNGFSTWMARPAKMLPSVSCSAKPMTTAPTADVVRNFSCITLVPITMKIPMMIVSWTMLGNCSGRLVDPPRVDGGDDDEVTAPSASSRCVTEWNCAIVAAESRPLALHSAPPMQRAGQRTRAARGAACSG